MKKFNKQSALTNLDRKHNHKNVKVISAFIGAVLTIILVIYFSFARFEKVTTYNLINGTVGAGERTTLLDHILSLNTSDLEYDGTDTLGENGTADNNLRYVGKRPNNFAYYNCTTTDPNQMSLETCELWNIIGVMNNIEDDNGNSASRIKLVNLSLYAKLFTGATDAHIAWDTSASTVNNGFGINQWGETTYEDGTPYEGADLMRELNTDYLGNITVATDGKWYSGQNDAKEANPISPLSTSAINMIQSAKWNTGTNTNESFMDNESRPPVTVKEIYDYERSDNVIKKDEEYSFMPYSGLVHTSSWTGKVALPYMSDYFYSISNGELSYKNECLGKNINAEDYYDDTNDCHKYSWFHYVLTLLLNGSNESDEGIDNFVSIIITSINPSNMLFESYVYAAGLSGNNSATSGAYPTPSIYLKNEVNYLGGDGSFTNPYKIGM